MTDHRSARLRAAVRSTPMFSGLVEAEQERIESIARLRDLQRGDVVWSAGDPADSLNLIVRGRAKIVRHGTTGDVILEIFGSGEPLGAIATYNRIPYPASAVAMEPTVLLCVPARDYFDLLDRNPDMARSLIRELTRINLMLSRTLAEYRGQRVDARIAQLLLTLAERTGSDTPEGVRIPFPLTRQEVAEMVGTTVESAIRVLSRWGREGLVITAESGFVIPSAEALREVTEPSGDA